LCNRFLRAHWKLAVLPQSFQILDSADQASAVKRVIKAMNLDEERYVPKQVAWFVAGAKEDGLRPKDIELRDEHTRKLVEIYQAYEDQCQREGTVDFGELMLRTYELMRDNAPLREHYQRRFRHILVDEFQDTNKLQYDWLRVLAGDRGVLFAVGDDDQCLPAGTPVTMADGSTRPIEAICAGDAVLSAYGSGDFRPARVSETLRIGRRSQLIRIRLRSGRELSSTPEHVHFAGYLLGETPQLHFTYLMHKRGVGYRIGTSQVYTRGQVKPKVGFEQRCLHEHADAAWVVSTHASENAARAEEMLLSLRYGIPTLPFVPRKGGSKNGLVHDAEWIAKIFGRLDTGPAAERLLADFGLGPREPHHRPQSRDSKRRNIVITLCGDRRGTRPMHRISIVGNDMEGRAALQMLGLSVRAAKAGSRSWRFETCRKDFGELMLIAGDAVKALDGEFVMAARLGRRSLPFVRAAAVRQGMVMLAGDGSFDIVEDVEMLEGPVEVHDINVESTHNFIAHGIVTHNSVYSWRGARVENMLHLQRDFLGCEIVRLEQNYRSTGTILRAANGLIAKNSGRLGKNLWTEGREGESIQLYAAFNEYDEAEFVVNRIREGIDGQRRYSDHAILYRTSAQSRVLEEILIRNRMPYRITGGLRFFERQEIKDALAFLRLLHNRDDDACFERAVGTPPRGIGATTIEKLRLWGREQDVSLWAAAKTGGSHIGRSANAVNSFMQLVEAIAAEGKDLPLSQLTELVIARSGLRDHYRKEKGEQAEGRLENLDELVSAARGFELLPLTPGEDLPDMDPLSAFLGHAALEAGEEQAGPGEDSVQLMTLHAAKGLEFPVVFLVGVENGLFPNMRSIEEGNLEEERRLCYVGITRAREQLYISYAEVRRVHGVEQIGTPSQFLKDIPAETLQETRPRAHIVRPAFTQRDPAYGGYGGYSQRSQGYGGGYGASRPAPVKDSGAGPGGFTLGQRVSHAKFGEGTILSFDGDGDRARVEVRFKTAGNKWLLISVANLQGH